MGFAPMQVVDTLRHGELLAELYSAWGLLYAKMLRRKADKHSKGL
jgi:hypothetical protein